MVWVHADRFADGEDTQSIYPWRLWQLKSDPTQGVNPGIGFFQANDNSANLMATYEKWEIRADDATGIPRYTYGNERAGGSADTATGLSMLMNNAAKGLRRAISNIDLHVTSKTIGQTFVNEMLYNSDDSIKGDCIVVPRGAAAILIKESAQQRRTQFLELVAGNPVLAQLLGPKYLTNIVREVATAMELPVDEVVPSEEVVEEQQAQQAQQAQQQQQALQQQAQQENDMAAQRDTQSQNAKLIGDIVKEAVSAALAQRAGAEGKPGRKMKFSYGDDGLLTEGEEVTQ
jgi:Sec-independent protein translocase protein TatA